MVGLGESVKKENSWQKSFFQILLNEVLKSCKNIFADVKADVKHQEIKEVIAVSCNFL